MQPLCAVSTLRIVITINSQAHLECWLRKSPVDTASNLTTLRKWKSPFIFHLAFGQAYTQ